MGGFLFNNIFSEIHYDKEDNFLKYFVKILPKEIKKKSFAAIKNKKKECAKRLKLTVLRLPAQPLMKIPFL